MNKKLGEVFLLANWLRWILVLPVAIVAYILAIVFNNISTGMMIGRGDFSLLLIDLFNSFIAPVAFIWFGSKVAPAHRFVTALSLAAIYILITGYSMAASVFYYNQYSAPTWRILLSCAIGLGATIMTCAMMYQDHIKEKEKAAALLYQDGNTINDSYNQF